jgi:transposase
MGYRRVTTEQLGVIWTQMKSGASNRAIARDLGFDRKTIKTYVEAIRNLGFPQETSHEEALRVFAEHRVGNEKPKPARAVLAPFTEEIRELIAGDRKANRQPMKAKTAWLVVNERHNLDKTTSYETFKRFVKERRISRPVSGPTVRIETQPGDETQIDYAKMGLWPIGGRNRVVQAFIGTLAYSRLPFVHFCTSQDQASFACSITRMLDFYGGSTRRINLDNLKAGVLEADIYDPTLNRTFAELCDHYGIIADPARPASPKDKGKVERIVQVVRELWKQLTAVHPTASLDELNELAMSWAREEYGMEKHGTTGVPPCVAFNDLERSTLTPLPAERFVAASWTVAKVHPDQFISVGKKLYGLPASFIGKTVQVRSKEGFVEIFCDHRSIRKYVIPQKGRAYLPDDFPAYGEPFVPGAYAASLIVKAGSYGPQAAKFIRLILEDGGQLSIRRAQGCLTEIARRYGMTGFSSALGQAIAGRVFIPRRLAVLFEDEAHQNVLPFPISESGKAMTRDAGYYAGP